MTGTSSLQRKWRHTSSTSGTSGAKRTSGSRRISIGWKVTSLMDSHTFGRIASTDVRRRSTCSWNGFKKDAYTPMYAAQSMLAEWIGDTRIVERPPFINVDQIEEIELDLKPGDILLERRNWCMSNAFLPGFWPHAALYVGRIEDLRRLGIASDPAVQEHMEGIPRTRTRWPRPHGHRIGERRGHFPIRLRSQCTPIMLRPYARGSPMPRLPRQIVRAFRHKGRPYDFEFDFFTADKLVCTELIYRAYEGMLHFDLVRVMGRDTLPALEIVRKFARERQRPDHELEFVLFLDAAPETGRAERVTEEELCASAGRPRAFNE